MRQIIISGELLLNMKLTIKKARLKKRKTKENGTSSRPETKDLQPPLLIPDNFHEPPQETLQINNKSHQIKLLLSQVFGNMLRFQL